MERAPHRGARFWERISCAIDACLKEPSVTFSLEEEEVTSGTGGWSFAWAL